MRDVTAGTIVCEKGEPANGMFVVEQGTLEVHLDDGGSPRILGPGSLLGEIALLTPEGRRTATVIAATDCRLKLLDRAHFDEFLRKKPALACAALQHACAYLIESEQRLADDLRHRNVELESALDYLRRTR